MTALLSITSPSQEAVSRQFRNYISTLGALPAGYRALFTLRRVRWHQLIPGNKGLSNHDKSTDLWVKCVCVERQIILVLCTGHLLL